jgi:hypothetical protein
MHAHGQRDGLDGHLDQLRENPNPQKILRKYIRHFYGFIYDGKNHLTDICLFPRFSQHFEMFFLLIRNGNSQLIAPQILQIRINPFAVWIICSSCPFSSKSNAIF